MTETELLELKQQIVETSEEVKKLETRKELLMEQLEKDWGIKTTTAARKKVSKLEKEITELDEQVLEATEKLEEQLDERTADIKE